MQSSVN